MVALTNIVTVNVTTLTQGFQQPGFGIPNIIGATSSTITKGSFNIFTDMIGVAAVFSSSAAEYKAANAIFSQEPAPQSIYISRELDRVAQVATVVFSGNIITGNTIHITINNTVLSVPFNTSNAQSLTDLATALTISGISTAVSDGSHTVTVTSAVAGIPFTLSAASVSGGASQATVVLTTTVANVGFAETLASISNVDDTWYGIIWTERTLADVLYAASVVEALDKVYITATNAAGCYDPASTTDLLYLLKASSYTRTAGMYSAVYNTQFPDAAWMGANFPKAPGSENWAYTTLLGVTADNLTQAQYTAIVNKNGNMYVPFANRFGTFKGWAGSGLYLDFRRGIDWVVSEMLVNVADVIFQPSTGQRLPYTDYGVAQMEAAMRGVLELGVKNNFIQPGYEVFAVPVADESTANKAARYYPDLSFTATFTNGIDTAVVNGTIGL